IVGREKSAVVAGGGDDEGALAPGVGDGILLGLGVVVTAEGDVADERAVIGCIHDGGGEVALVGVALIVRYSQGHDVRVDSDSHGAAAIVGGGSGDARDVGAVAECVGSVLGRESGEDGAVEGTV